MKTLRNNKGFTLVEALIAMAILSLGIMTLITMQTTVIKGNSKARGITTASLWAQSRIEELVTADFDTIVDGTVPSPDGHYIITWTVDSNILTSVPDLPIKKIEVTVSRNDFGLQRAVTFNYYRQKNY